MEGLSRSGLRRVVLVLSVTEITSWGVLYYAFPVLLTSIGDDTGWSATSLAAAFSARVSPRPCRRSHGR